LFLVAGQFVAFLLNLARGDYKPWWLGSTSATFPEAYLLPFLVLHKRPWNEVLVLDNQHSSTSDPEKKKKKEALVERLMSDSYKLLREAFFLQLPVEHRPLLGFFTPELYSHLLGGLDINDNGIDLPNPLEELVKAFPESSTERHNLLSLASKVSTLAIQIQQDSCSDFLHDDEDDDEEEEDGEEQDMEDGEGAEDEEIEDNSENSDSVFPSFDGLGLFPIESCFNHSCTPNVIVKFFEDNTAHIVAHAPIKKGEELLHSYVNYEAPLLTRRKQLREYGFTCVCLKCQNEQASLQ